MIEKKARLAVYDFDTKDTTLSVDTAGMRFVYASETPVRLFQAGEETVLEPDEGRIVSDKMRISGAGWLFDLTEDDQAPLAGPLIDPVLSHQINLDFAGPWMFRADRVASNAGAQTPQHGHRGPGIRRLKKGRIKATIGGNIERIEAGQAWFETGKDWVVGENISNDENIFIRVMVLPLELQGGLSSFVPASPEEASRPRAVNYRLFGELAVPSPFGGNSGQSG